MTSAHSGISSDLRSDVQDILGDAVQWKLPRDQWPLVEALVERLRLALQAGNAAEVEKLVTDLELAAPLRIQPIGGPPTEPAPDRLRHVAKDIVHDLDEGLEAPEADEDHGAGR
ncbi:hypothetical protein LFM09_33765 [Lentzea alba]|uniref:CATRA system-associated protein n=1 Tax=Lentzea alba TaxID=2714351 RepID=UPI0039BF2C5D